MTDLERIRAMLERAGLNFCDGTPAEPDQHAGKPELWIVGGHGFAALTFDPDTGALIAAGGYEGILP